MYDRPTDRSYNSLLPSYQSVYPIDAFPDIIRQAVLDVDAKLGGGIELGASAALGVVSLVCQGAIDVRRPKLAPSSCSLFLITIAESGMGKSEIQNRFLAEVFAFEAKEEARHRSLPDEYRKISRSKADELLPGLLRKAAELTERRHTLEIQRRRMTPAFPGREVEVRRKRTFTPYASKEPPSATSRREEPRTGTSSLERQHDARAERPVTNPGLDKVVHELNELEQEEARISAAIRNATGPARQLVYARGSFAGFRDGLQEKCRSAGVISDEAGDILNSRLISGNMSSWNDLWGCERYRETYQKREYFIERPRLTVSLMLQPGQFNKFLAKRGEDALDNGFLSRTLLLRVVPCRARKSDESGDDDAKIESLETFNQRVREILERQFAAEAGPLVLEFSSEAQRCWNRYWAEVTELRDSGSLDPRIVGFAMKLPEQAARVAALFHYFAGFHKSPDAYSPRSQGEIPLDTMLNAISVCRWYLLEFRRLIVEDENAAASIGGMAYSQNQIHAQKILNTIKKNYRKYWCEQRRYCIRLNYKEIQNTNRPLRKPDIIAALEVLHRDGEVYLSRGPKGGYYVCYGLVKGNYPCGQCRF